MQSATAPALDHLLRTLAPVPTTCRILSLGASETAYAASAALLGFDVAACDLSEDAVPRLAPHLQPASDHFTHLNDPAQLPYPDAAFDWIVASTLLAEAAVQDLLPELLKETRRVLKPGGWIYIIARAAPPDAPARNGAPASLPLHPRPPDRSSGSSVRPGPGTPPRRTRRRRLLAGHLPPRRPRHGCLREYVVVFV